MLNLNYLYGALASTLTAGIAGYGGYSIYCKTIVTGDASQHIDVKEEDFNNTQLELELEYLRAEKNKRQLSLHTEEAERGGDIKALLVLKQANLAIKGQIEAAQKKKGELDLKLVKDERDYEEDKRAISKLVKDIGDLEEKMETYKRVATLNNEKSKELLERYEEHIEQVKKAEEVLVEAKSQYVAAKDASDKKRVEIVQKKEDLTKQETSESKAKDAYEKQIKQEDIDKKAYEAQVAVTKEACDVLKTNEEKKTSLQKEIDTQTNKKNVAQSEVNDASSKLTAIQEKIRAKEEALAKAKEEVVEPILVEDDKLDDSSKGGTDVQIAPESEVPPTPINEEVSKLEKEIKELKDEETTATSTKEDKEKTCNSESSNLQNLEEKKKELDNTINLQKTTCDAEQQKQNDAKKVWESSKQQKSTLETTHKSEQEKTKKLKGEIAEAEDLFTSLENTTFEKEANQETKQTELDNLKALTAEITKAKDACPTMDEVDKDDEKNLNAWKVELETLKKSKDSKESIYAQTQVDLKKNQEELESLMEVQLVESDKQISDKEKVIEKHDAEILKLNGEIKQFVERIKVIKALLNKVNGDKEKPNISA